MICFVSGHLDLTEAELVTHYEPRFRESLARPGREQSGTAKNLARRSRAG